MIVLFTDFGLHGPYTGQVKAVLHQTAPGVPAIDLFADAPMGNPKASAYLLAVYAAWFPEDGADRRGDWPDDLCEIIYVDHFGNAMTGLRAATLPRNTRLAVAGRVLERQRTFSDGPPGAAFWYENSNGLAEIAVNQGRADRDLGLAIGTAVEIVS
jgi:S-adenosylmethionine hydrolase